MDRQTEHHADTDGHVKAHTGTYKCRQTRNQTARQAGRLAYRQTGRQTCRRAGIHADKQAYRRAVQQTSRQMKITLR